MLCFLGGQIITCLFGDLLYRNTVLILTAWPAFILSY
jgi:hypothetical protein